MFSKKLAVATAVTILFIASCQTEEAMPIGEMTASLSMGTDEPEPCYRCLDLVIGSYFFEGTEIWIPNAANSPMQPGNTHLSVEVDWDGNRVVFRSSEFRFCRRPPKIWTYADFNLQDLFLYECQPEWVSTSLSLGRHELTLVFDDGFLPCAFESEMAGFKFAVPVF